MEMRCNKCGKSMPVGETCICSNCGSILCRECAEKNFYMCDHCSGDLNYLN